MTDTMLVYSAGFSITAAGFVYGTGRGLLAKLSAILTLRLESYGIAASTTTTRALINGAGFSWLMLNRPLIALQMYPDVVT